MRKDIVLMAVPGCVTTYTTVCSWSSFLVPKPKHRPAAMKTYVLLMSSMREASKRSLSCLYRVIGLKGETEIGQMNLKGPKRVKIEHSPLWMFG